MKLSDLIGGGVSRRGFLGGAAKGAAAAMTGNPAALAGGSALGELSGASDDKLMNTPEQYWVNKIPFSRLVRIIKKGGTYGPTEIGNKLMTLIAYGSDHKGMAGIAKLLVRAFKSSGGDIKSQLPGIVHAGSYGFDGKINWSELFDQSDASPVEMGKAAFEQARKDAETLSKVAGDVGLPVDHRSILPVMKQKYFTEIKSDVNTARYLEKKRGKKRQSRKESPEEIGIPQDYAAASSMHQPFEQKLLDILAMFG